MAPRTCSLVALELVNMDGGTGCMQLLKGNVSVKKEQGERKKEKKGNIWGLYK